MNGGFQTGRDDIGTDPTTVEVVDVLDLDNSNTNQTNNNENPNNKGKAKSLVKKILLAFFILLLMALVAFGVYFYLHLGKKKVAEKPKFVLDDKTVYVEAELSKSIFDYGDFSSVDISGCTLDTSKVNTKIKGEYEYSMICDGDKYTGKITVVDKYDFEITANVLYKTSSDVLIASEFMTDSHNYTYNLKDKNVTDYLYTPGGPYYVELEAEDKEDKDKDKGTVSSIMYVTEAKARNFLTCTSDSQKLEEPQELTYYITDVFAFDSFRNYLHVPSRIYVFDDLIVDEYITLINTIENGTITLGDITGYALRDDSNNVLRIAVEFTDEMLNDETDNIRLTFNNIKKHYEDNKYTCK